MERRQFLAASLVTTAAALTPNAGAQAASSRTREFYQLRRYLLQSGPQVGLTEHYLNDALIPALAKRGMGPIGAFRLDIGPETPAYYVLIPSISVDLAATIDLQLAQDTDFLRAADAFWAAPATANAFVRVDSTLLAAFEGWPRVTPPDTHAKRIFQLRTYESPSHRDHVRKVEMFHAGEFDIFKAAGFHNVFFGDTLVGARMPSLTYMLSFPSIAELDAHWDTFRNHPDWKKLSADPKFAYEPIVSNITNLILSPLPSSQV
jgi:hypothetical protein